MSAAACSPINLTFLSLVSRHSPFPFIIHSRKIQSLESELNAVHNENDGLRREKHTLTSQVHSLEADRDEANGEVQKLAEQLNVEREEHEAKVDEATASFSGVIGE